MFNDSKKALHPSQEEAESPSKIVKKEVKVQELEKIDFERKDRTKVYRLLEVNKKGAIRREIHISSNNKQSFKSLTNNSETSQNKLKKSTSNPPKTRNSNAITKLIHGNMSSSQDNIMITKSSSEMGNKSVKRPNSSFKKLSLRTKRMELPSYCRSFDNKNQSFKRMKLNDKQIVPVTSKTKDHSMINEVLLFHLHIIKPIYFQKKQISYSSISADKQDPKQSSQEAVLNKSMLSCKKDGEFKNLDRVSNCFSTILKKVPGKDFSISGFKTWFDMARKLQKDNNIKKLSPQITLDSSNVLQYELLEPFELLGVVLYKIVYRAHIAFNCKEEIDLRKYQLLCDACCEINYFSYYIDVQKLANALKNVYMSGDYEAMKMVQELLYAFDLSKSNIKFVWLQNIVAHPEEIRTIKLRNYSSITKEAFQFLHTLFKSEEARNTLFQAFEGLDLPFDHEDTSNMTPKIVSQHLVKLIPEEIVKYGPSDSARGKTYGKNRIAINTKLLKINPNLSSYKKKQYIARLAMTLIHEIAHMKRKQYYSKRMKGKPTPEKFNKEARRYVERILFGFDETHPGPDFYNMSSEMATAFLKISSWKNPGFLKSFVKPLSSPLAEIHSNQDEDYSTKSSDDPVYEGCCIDDMMERQMLLEEAMSLESV